MSKKAEKHWFLMSFQVQHPGTWVPMSFLVALDDMSMSVPQMNAAKQANRVPDSSVLIAVSYLGYKTEKAMNGLPEVDEPTVLSDPYKEGLLAAGSVDPSSPSQPLNPYSMTNGDPVEIWKMNEWANGVQAMQEVKRKVSPGPPPAEHVILPTTKAVAKANK